MGSKKYYAVECKCGHTGSRMFYIPIKFPIVAENGREAAEKARWIPRCKHHHKDCILSVEEISIEEFIELQNVNQNDPYLRCTSIQEQQMFDISDRFVVDSHYCDDEDEKEQPIHQRFFGKKRIKNPKRFVRNYYFEEAYSY